MHSDLPLDQILIGDCRELIKTLPDESVNCVVTSPPYWGLRSYGTDPQVWQNGHEPCIEHQWGDVDEIVTDGRTRNSLPNDLSKPRGNGRSGFIEKTSSNRSTCSLCGAWRGELGLEPTPELYVEHLAQIFREVKRVLRDDGTLWLNLGDSYIGSTFIREESSDGWANKGDGEAYDKYYAKNGGGVRGGKRRSTAGLKVKDLCGIPWMVAFALRADGWYLRSDIIWAKPNPMPESVTDRPTKSHEYIFLLSKSQKYYYDAESIKERAETPPGVRKAYSVDTSRIDAGYDGHRTRIGLSRDGIEDTGFRNRRTVWTVATHPFKGAHFATFPPKLIEPCILAGCPEGGTVLDPFMGSGTTASVCISLKRHYIGFDLNPTYVEGIAQDRADGTPPPLFVI